MTIAAWRIVRARYAATAFSGEAARRFGGRWNSKGTALVYTAGSQALAALEMLVHLDSADLLQHYRLFPVSFDESLVEIVELSTLPARWRRRASVRRTGDEWVESSRSAVLQVPSAVVPGESNFLLNVSHPDFVKIKIGQPLTYRFDRRLK
jgi:RES domain-containing protein